LAAAYKDFGSEKINDDKFLALVGSISFLMNGVFRIVFAQWMDLSSFKLVYGVLVGVQIVVSATLNFVAGTKWLFFIWMCAAMACEGGHFSLYSALCAKLFGKDQGGSVFSILYYCFGTSSILGFVLQLYIVKVHIR
jgi:MFS family permease